jgi:hypothetical protein
MGRWPSVTVLTVFAPFSGLSLALYTSPTYPVQWVVQVQPTEARHMNITELEGWLLDNHATLTDLGRVDSPALRALYVRDELDRLARGTRDFVRATARDCPYVITHDAAAGYSVISAQYLYRTALPESPLEALRYALAARNVLTDLLVASRLTAHDEALVRTARKAYRRFADSAGYGSAPFSRDAEAFTRARDALAASLLP